MSLSSFPFDSEPIISIKREHLMSILSDYIAGNITDVNVEEWANAVEARDDIAFESDVNSVGGQIVHDLANPLLSGPLTVDVAKKMRSKLE